jgi:hypothetical protein
VGCILPDGSALYTLLKKKYPPGHDAQAMLP